MENVDMQKVRI